jgi:hypothetical protein
MIELEDGLCGFVSSLTPLLLLSYYALTSCIQKFKLMGKGGQFIYTSTLPLTWWAHNPQVPELETFDSNTILSYCAPTRFTQNLKLMGKGSQFNSTSTTLLVVELPSYSLCRNT